jgi:putative GTP pyrophosphokinase
MKNGSGLLPKDGSSMNDSRAADDASALKEHYRQRYERVLVPLSGRLDAYLRVVVKDYKRVDRISVRAKAVDRFVEKATKLNGGEPKYTDPLNQIQDQLGARVVTFYLSDVRELSARIEDFFGSIEVKHVIPDSPREFGYEGKHYILFIPQDVMNPADADDAPTFFELQIKTLFQHAWGEADHDLIYKPVGGLTADQRRRVAFTAAQAWGADRIFDELAQELAAPPSALV